MINKLFSTFSTFSLKDDIFIIEHDKCDLNLL